LQTKQRLRIYYTESQKALMWERWLKGDALQQIARLFDRNHAAVQGARRFGVSNGRFRRVGCWGERPLRKSSTGCL
jgi:hypothetical protein